MIISPRYIALDTSTISKMAKAYFSADMVARKSAESVRNWLFNENWILTLSCDHLLELAQHSNEDIVVSRFRFLKTFPHLAWVKNIEQTGIGSFLDVDCLEIQAFIDDPTQTKKSIVDRVRDQILFVGSGDELFRDSDYRLWIQLARESKHASPRSQSTASLLRAEPVQGLRQLKLHEFLNTGPMSKADIKKNISRLAAVMAEQIRRHGDKRIANAEALATEFYSQTWQHITDVQNAMASNNGESAFVEAIAVHFGIPARMIDFNMTVGQLGDWGHFSMMLRIYSRKLGFSLSLEVVQPEVLPGWSLRLALSDYQNQANNVSGSDFGDRTLACMIPYLDSCEVDKRTMDYLRRITDRNQSQFDYLRHWFKCSEFSQIPKSLPI